MRGGALVLFGVIAVGVIVFAPLAALVLGIGILSQLPLTEAVIFVLGLVVFTVVYWGLVRASARSGLARWDEQEPDDDMVEGDSVAG